MHNNISALQLPSQLQHVYKISARFDICTVVPMKIKFLWATTVLSTCN